MNSLMILIAGPYRSGTRNDPALIAANLARLEEAAWPLFAAGHVPMIGEWVALPVMRSAPVAEHDGSLADRVLYPTAQRLLTRCDGVLRLRGESAGADQDVATARRLGLPVWHRIEDVPGCVAPVHPAERIRDEVET
jgi:hypothetical protein